MAAPKSRPKTSSRIFKSVTAPSRQSLYKSDDEKNQAPSQWGRRLARIVGDKFGVKMSSNFARNEGTFGKKDIVIKCAKSTSPPIFVLTDTLDRVDEVWGVFLTAEDEAEVWSITSRQVREFAYFTTGPNVQSRAEINYRKVKPLGKLVGLLTADEVAACRIP